MKSGTKAIKSNKTGTERTSSIKKKEVTVKETKTKKDNIKINLAETNRKVPENIKKSNNNELKKSQLTKTKIKTMIRKPTEQQNNISVIQNEPTIKKKIKQEDEITDRSAASKKSIMKDGVLLIDDPKLKKLIEESRRNYAKRFLKNGEGDKNDKDKEEEEDEDEEDEEDEDSSEDDSEDGNNKKSKKNNKSKDKKNKDKDKKDKDKKNKDKNDKNKKSKDKKDKTDKDKDKNKKKSKDKKEKGDKDNKDKDEKNKKKNKK